MPESLIRLRKRSLLPTWGAALLLVLVASPAFLVVLVRRLFRGRRHPLWSFRKELVAEIARNTTVRLLHVTPDVLRQRLMPAPIALAVRLSVRHERSRHGSSYAEIFTPRGWTPSACTLLYFHGGGYIAGSPATHRDLVARIARASGARCIVVDYRKAPEHPYPAPLDDGEAAYKELLASGTPPERIFVGGDSAGGGMALAVMLRARQAGLPLPRAGVLLSPWVDLTRQGHSVAANAAFDYLTPESLEYGVGYYLQGHDPRDPEVSPLFADLAGLPPLLIQTGDAELFFSENQALAERAVAAGIEVVHQIEPGMVHVFQLFASFAPECGPAIDRIGAHMRDLAARPWPAAGKSVELLQAS
jgi:monoterpene epsilon-lactone hydrolase